MEPFHYQDHQLYCESVPVARLAETYGTPLYIYSRAALLEQLQAIQHAFAALKPLVCFSVKANSNLSLLQLLAEHGSAFDVVSSGELHRVQTAGGDPGKTVFAGVGKTDAEIKAAIEAGVLMFNVESEAELEAINQVALSMGRVAPIALRVNPDVDPKTHRYISTGKKQSKFGMDIERAERVARHVQALPGLEMIGLHMHIGSQITTVEPYAGAVAKGVDLISRFRAQGHPIAWFNMGGGFGIAYRGPEAKAISDFAKVIVPQVESTGCRLVLEPGRVIAGNSGLLVSRVIFTKTSGEKTFLIQDAAMNDLIRPALYESFHKVWPVSVPAYPLHQPTLKPRSPAPPHATWWDRFAKAATSWPKIARCLRSTGETCWRSSRQARTAWSWPPITTPGREPLRSLLKEIRHAWFDAEKPLMTCSVPNRNSSSRTPAKPGQHWPVHALRFWR